MKLKPNLDKGLNTLYNQHGEISSINYEITMAWKYNEEELLQELRDYISGTYGQHYSAGNDSIQTLDLIEAC